jgi:thymidylate kinase
VAEGYRELAIAEPERIRVVEAGGDSAAVTAGVLSAIEDLLPQSS